MSHQCEALALFGRPAGVWTRCRNRGRHVRVALLVNRRGTVNVLVCTTHAKRLDLGDRLAIYDPSGSSRWGGDPGFDAQGIQTPIEKQRAAVRQASTRLVQARDAHKHHAETVGREAVRIRELLIEVLSDLTKNHKVAEFLVALRENQVRENYIEEVAGQLVAEKEKLADVYAKTGRT